MNLYLKGPDGSPDALSITLSPDEAAGLLKDLLELMPMIASKPTLTALKTIIAEKLVP